MRHLKSGRKLKRTSSHRKALLKNMATSLFEHKKLFTTEAKAKELRPYAEVLITKAKHALSNEKQGALPNGQTVDIHNRRVVGRSIRNKAVLQELFDTIAPMVEERQGGYTRIVKTGTRRGDAGRTAIIELVDWAAPQDGAVNKKSRRKPGAKAKTTAPAKEVKAVKEIKNTEEAPLATSELIEEAVAPVEVIETISETVVAEAQPEEPVTEVQPEAESNESTEIEADEAKTEEEDK